jgi:hypothetical protein
MTARVVACPPLFFAQRREWGSFVINGALYAVALLCLAAAVVAGVARDVSWAAATVFAVFFWILCVVHVVDTRRREHAKALVAAISPPRLQKTKRLIRTAVFLVSFVAILISLRSISTSTGQSVGPQIPPVFPVLIVWPESGEPSARATIVLHTDLAEFLRQHLGSRYLVPQGHEARLKAGLSDGSFDVQRRADGTQAFEVRRQLHPEAFVIGWYEASEHEFVPRRLVVFHEMMLGFFSIPALFASFLLSWLVGKILDAKLP